MSHRLINHSPDLKRLRDEGHELEIKAAYLFVHHVPYVNSKREIAFGTLVSSLCLAGEKTAAPDNHVIHFIGDAPCHSDGTPINAIMHPNNNQAQVLDAANGIAISRSFSNRPATGYKDYYEKVTRYIRIISAEAEFIDRSVTAKTFRAIPSADADGPFKYLDTNSSRAEINNISSKLQNLKIAIIGLGGTGSYILDLVSKTPVHEIHIFDGDNFLQHNAFRAPGAALLQKLEEQPKKVCYLHEMYSNMHRGIIPHATFCDSANFEKLSPMNFVFICIDQGEVKKLLFENLISNRIPFVDVGIGVQVIDGLLTGSIRTTTGTPQKNDHLRQRVPLGDGGDNEYSQNIQVAELNALNAALAVIKWKKLFGVFHDLEKEHNSVYSISINSLANDETLA